MKGTRRNLKGAQTRARILASARTLLLSDGYDDFVFRTVAKGAGVKLGNVQYYFPHKKHLLWAVLEPELQNYLDRLGAELLKGRTSEEKIYRMVHYLIEDVATDRTLRLWLSIWDMAVHDPEVSRTVGRFYRTYVDALANLLRQVYPSLDADRAGEVAVSMTAYFDGLMVVMQVGKPRRKSLAAVKRHVHATVTRIIDA